MWNPTVPRLDASLGKTCSPWHHLSPEEASQEPQSFPSPGLVPSPNRLRERESSEAAGEELSFDDVFENGGRENSNSFDHRRSRSVLSLDDIPEERVVQSLEHATSLLSIQPSCTIQEETESDATPKLGPSDFELLAVIGQGAFGKVLYAFYMICNVMFT